MATVSLRLQDCSSDLVRLCLDVPRKQRSKQYYLNAIEEYLKNCQQTHIVLVYLGHSEEGTGNWCFEDGTISFQEIFDLNRRHCPGKPMTIMPDCCYSGNWVKKCAKTLDNLGIPPCGHRAKEQGILIKVYTSCQPDQKATEPCYSIEEVTVENDDTLLFFTKKQASETQKFCGTDFTKLVCCRGPDESCRSEDVLKNWTWQDAMKGEIISGVYLVKGTDKDRSVWYYLLLSSTSEEHTKRFAKELDSDIIELTKCGYIVESGYGESPPDDITNKLKIWMDT